MKVTESHPNALRAIADQLKAVGKKQARVGWLDSNKYENGMKVSTIMAQNEYGNPNISIPARPFMRPTIAEKSSSWAALAAVLTENLAAGKITATDFMEALGEQAEADIVETIAKVTQPPLSPITIGARKYRKDGKKVTGRTIGEIARKLAEGKLSLAGISTKPLNDTGYAIATLTHIVED